MGLRIDRLPKIEFLRDLTQPTVHRRPVAVKLLHFRHLRLVGVMYLRQPDEQLNSLEGVLLDFWHQQKAELMNFLCELFLLNLTQIFRFPFSVTVVFGHRDSE
jgi:hypothetical protein